MEDVSGQQLLVNIYKVHLITVRRDKGKPERNLQGNRSIFNQIKHIRAINNKLISLPTKPPTPYHTGDVVRSSLRLECSKSIFDNYENMVIFTSFSATLKRSLLPLGKKILRPRISFRVKPQKFIINMIFI